jgi:hypothetical protein
LHINSTLSLSLSISLSLSLPLSWTFQRGQLNLYCHPRDSVFHCDNVLKDFAINISLSFDNLNVCRLIYPDILTPAYRLEHYFITFYQIFILFHSFYVFIFLYFFILTLEFCLRIHMDNDSQNKNHHFQYFMYVDNINYI